MSQRRLDGVTTRPFTATPPEPECVDCGVTEKIAHPADSSRWPDGKMLRKYSDGDFSCQPCANGAPIEDVRYPAQADFVADKVFPSVEVEGQDRRILSHEVEMSPDGTRRVTTAFVFWEHDQWVRGYEVYCE